MPPESEEGPPLTRRSHSGHVLSCSCHVSDINATGAPYEISEPAHSPTAAYGDPLDLLITRRCYGPNNGTLLQGCFRTSENPERIETSRTYELCTWDDAPKDSSGPQKRSEGISLKMGMDREDLLQSL